MAPEEFLARSAELDWIVNRAMDTALVWPDAMPCVHRAAIQLASFVAGFYAPSGKDVLDLAQSVIAVHSAEFESLVGRPFDPSRDSITWEEVDRLPIAVDDKPPSLPFALPPPRPTSSESSGLTAPVC